MFEKDYKKGTVKGFLDNKSIVLNIRNNKIELSPSESLDLGRRLIEMSIDIYNKTQKELEFSLLSREKLL